MKYWPWLLLTACLPSMALGASIGRAELKRDFSAIDGNGDDRLSWPEFESRVMEVFYFADLDNDGVITREQAPRGMAGPWEDIDRDGDGRLGATEFVEYHRGLFASADRDGDGQLSSAEADALPGASAAR